VEFFMNLRAFDQSLTQFISGPVAQVIPRKLRDTFLLRAFGVKIPLLLFATPSVVELTDDRCEIKIPLNRRTKNHLGSMYFGALSIGADCAGGMIAFRMIEKSGVGVSLIFKDFQAEFLKRAEGDVHFSCENGKEISELVERTIETGERQNLSVQVTATVPSKVGIEPVARFVLTLSLKRKNRS
jgi:acyl-coenzyme A thioesterase PaaI-like protein